MLGMRCMFCGFSTGSLIKVGRDKYAHTACITQHKAGMRVPFKLRQLPLRGCDRRTL